MGKRPCFGGAFFIMKIEDEIQQSRKFETAHEKAVVNILYTANRIENLQQDFFKQFGITGQQYNILRILKGQHPESISGTEIKSRMLDKNSDVSRLLDRLATKNLVLKKACSSDKRATDVTITSQGIALLTQILKKQKVNPPLLFLSEQEATQLSDLLDKSRGK